MDILNEIGYFLQTSLQMGTHILLAIVGGIMCEKVGNMNLGIEGMMLMGASFGYFIGVQTGNPLLAMLCAGLAGAVGALIYAIITVTFRGNQVVTGLVLTIFGSGVAGFIGKSISGISLSGDVTGFFAAYSVPLLSDIPIIGKALFQQSFYVQMAIVVSILCYFYFKKTRLGLNARAVGENPGAADASGINVTLYKYLHITGGGFLCGLGGAYLSLVFLSRWQDDITAGAGWIAVALIIFSTWNPLKAILGAYLFGLLKGLNFKLQNIDMGFTIPSKLLDMVPYIATIVVLILITLRKKKENQPPAALSNPYFREER